MWDSGSDRESASSEDEREYRIDGLKIHLSADKIDELVKRAKQIAPFLEKNDVLLLYRKECLENESIFTSKLKMMAQNRKDAENDTDGWFVYDSKNNDSQNKYKSKMKKEEQALRQKYANYNFLEDSQLLRRVKKIDQGRKKDHHPRQDSQPRTRTNKGRKYVEKNDGRDERPRNTDTKFNEKQTSFTKQTSGIRYVEKKENAKGKEETKASPVKDTKKVAEPKKEEVKREEEKKEQPKKEEPKVENKVETKVETKAEPKKEDPKAEPKKDTKKQEPQPTPQPNKATQKPPAVETKPALNKIDQDLMKAPDSPVKNGITSTSSIKSYGSLDSESVKQKFQESCKQNPYVLSYLKPGEKVQRIEYVYTPEGRATEVKVRVLLDA